MVKKVEKLSPVERFLYWIKERHQIYLRRKSGKPKPWTDDEVLQKYFFTNPYRENDKTSVWFRENVRNLLQDDDRILLATVVFRWFNFIPTGEILWKYGEDQEGCADLLTQWNSRLVLAELGRRRDRGEQIFTGAFMINSPGGEPKLEAICRRVNNVWEDRKDLLARSRRWLALEQAHSDLTRYEGLGGFMAYEIVCDLRYTKFLKDATDKLTWCNPGPGAIRGLYRISGKEIENKSNSTSPPKPKDWLRQMTDLLKLTRKRLLGTGMPLFELREIEHSLCEFDKYSRALAGDGRLKRTYKGV